MNTDALDMTNRAERGMSERSSDTQQGFRPSTDERTCPLGDLDSAMVPAGSVSGRQVVTAAGVKESAII